jgi:hypothetical protein
MIAARLVIRNRAEDNRLHLASSIRTPVMIGTPGKCRLRVWTFLGINDFSVPIVTRRAAVLKLDVTIATVRSNDELGPAPRSSAAGRSHASQFDREL